MYELQQINPKILKKYYKTIEKINKTKHPYIILFSVMKDTFSHLLPTHALYFANSYIQKALSPLREQIKSKYSIRKFTSFDEATEVFNRIDKIIDYRIFNENKNKDFENIMNIIYDLLEYDLLEEKAGICYLYSLSHIMALAIKHEEALSVWKKLNKSKPPEANFDIARNTNDTKKKMIAFKLNSLNIDLANPLLSDEYRLFLEEQHNTLIDFTTHNHITIRTIRELKKIKDDFPNDSYIKAQTELSHILDADRPIEKREIYQSFFACVFGIYTFTSRVNHKKIPYAKLYKLATCISKFIFPEIKNYKKPLFIEERTKKPIVETCIFNNLSLVSFLDGRYKIKKEQDEIDFTEEYLNTIIHFSQRYLHLSKS